MNKDEQTIDSTTIRDFLLGSSTDQQTESFEERCMLDDDFFERVEIARDELLEEYSRDCLSKNDRSLVERHLLIDSENKRQLRLIVELQRLSRKPKQSSARRLETALWRLWPPGPIVTALAFATLVACFSASMVLWNQNFGLRRTIVQREEQLREGASSRQVSHPLPVIAFLVRPSSETRSVGTDLATLSVPVEPADIRFQFPVPKSSAFATYEIQIRETGGPQVWDQGGVTDALDGLVAIVVPSQILKPGDYRANVLGFTANGTAEKLPAYSFRLLRQ